ncbi:MAG: metallopeptidase family protein [Candidatus Dojkabacteria bacterium]|nr:metallopeptidase family protein [Candidatus Dojkabacteria bacterium]MDQ7021528.1 metallopeptidase family protein [Candidatus Dojkabacteria bacterium]
MYTVDFETFDRYVSEGIKEIPKTFRDRFNNVVFIIEDYPTGYQLAKMKMEHGRSLFGLYEGVSLQRRTSSYSGAIPDKITIFKNAIERYSIDEEHLKRIVKNTVWHEVAHHFGMNEEEVRSAEKERGHYYHY